MTTHKKSLIKKWHRTVEKKVEQSLEEENFRYFLMVYN